MRGALLFAVILLGVPGCRGQTSAAPSKSAATAPTQPGHGARAGFVVYTSDDGEVASWIVSYSLAAELQVDPPARLQGLWLLDERQPAPRVTVWDGARELAEADVERLWQARCPLTGREREAACTWPLEQVVSQLDADGRVIEQTIDGAACDCLELPVADLEVWRDGSYAELDDEEAWDDAFDGDPDDPNCRPQTRELAAVTAALFGGVVQRFTIAEAQDCSGAHVVDLVMEATRPLAGEPADGGFVAEGRVCEAAMPDDSPWPPPTPLVAAGERAASDDDEPSACDDLDATISSLRRGRLVRSELGADALGSCACHLWTAVRPELCPSPADPCGRTSAFPELMTTSSEFWVSADERAALVDGWEVVAAAGRLRARVEVDATPDEIIGVRHHGDIEPLLRASAAARGAAEDDGTAPPLKLRPASTSSPPALAPADVGKAERRGGRDWGNRCFAHFKARRYEAAEAACAKGLEAAQDQEIRGAIFFSLGRIAEARGAVAAARIYYRTSLALREDPTTEKHFERLRGR